MTNGEFVSRVLNGLKLLNQDEHVSKRYILRIGQNKSKFYIAQKLTDKSLLRESNLFKTIDCLRLDEEETIKCGIHEFMRCDSLMKSRKKIPGLVYNRLGSSIISVTTLNGDTVYNPTTLTDFQLSKNRTFVQKLKLKFYYIQDNFLYLPDSDTEYIRVTYIPFDESKIKKASDCQGEEDCDECKSMWDYDFIVPDKLSEQVISETIQEVSVGRSIPQDEMPNGDSNQKTTGNV